MNTETTIGERHPDRGYNQMTASGKPFYAQDPTPDIRLDDIAAQLARICRYGGALRDDIDHYSVAQHCVLCSYHVPEGFELEALFHDAHEAYLGDIIRPLKILQRDETSAVLERTVDLAIRNMLGLPTHMSPEVKEADNRAARTEYRDVLPRNRGTDFGRLMDFEPFPEIIIPWSSRTARERFMDRYYEL